MELNKEKHEEIVHMETHTCLDCAKVLIPKEELEKSLQSQKEDMKKIVSSMSWALATDPDHTHDGTRRPRVAVIDRDKLLKEIENL